MKNKIKWYDNAGIITLLIVLIIVIEIIVSQSFAVLGTVLSFSSVINHNTIYLCALVYFTLINFYFGRKYFNYLNVYVVFVYFIELVASIFTLVQSFGLSTFIGLLINLFIFIYLSHTMFRGTRIWKDLNLSVSPFNEITNDTYFCLIVILLVVNLIVNLISTIVLNGLFISILDSLYLLLFCRYIYLYREYLDSHKLDSNNTGNFDEIKEKISNTIDSIDVDGALDGAREIIKDVSSEIGNKASDIVDSIKDMNDDLEKEDSNKNGDVKKTKKNTEKNTKTKVTKKIGDDK